MVFAALLAPMAAALSPLAADAAEPPRLLPATPWNLRYDDQACRLVRTFGTGDDAVTAIFAKYAPTTHFEVMLSSKRLGPRGRQLRYRFVPGLEYAVEEQPLFGTAPDRVTSWQFDSALIPDAQLKAMSDRSPSERFSASRDAERARAAAIDGFEMKSGMDRSFVLATGKLDKPFLALETCLDDLVRTWGYDPVALRSLSAWPHPRSNPGTWAHPNDYPSAMVRKGVSGIVRFRLDVDSNGKPTKCVVQAAFSDPAFEKETCDILMERGRFEPAKDASGANVPAYWVSSVKWLI